MTTIDVTSNLGGPQSASSANQTQPRHIFEQGTFSSDMVIAPGGPRPRSDIHSVPDGARLHHTGTQVHVIDRDDKVILMVDQEEPPAPHTGQTDIVPKSSGWITYASWWNGTGSPISRFTTTWRVPSAPSTQSGQVIFLFNAIEPGNWTGILQPVLQWGVSAAGGGKYWSVASWYVGSKVFHTKLVKVNVGDELIGEMLLGFQRGSKFYYTSSFTNIANTSLRVANIPELKWATETLEAYNISGTSDYPATDATLMTGINISTVEAFTPAMTWSVTNFLADCGERTSVVTDGACNGIVGLLYRTGLGWTQSDLTTAASAPLCTGQPAGFTWSWNIMHVFYRGTDNGIHELWRDDRWKHNDLRKITSGPDAVSDPAAFTWSDDSSMHVIFRGSDNHIHEYWSKNNTWNHTNLTNETSAPLSDSKPAGYEWKHDSTIHVVYRGTDNHIHQLWLEADSSWKHRDLTSTTGGPLATGAPSGYIFDHSNSQHITYRGADEHVHELCYFDSKGWTDTDISKKTGAPVLVAGNTYGYAWEADSSQHVLYRGVDGKIHELWWKGSWHYTNLSKAAGSSPAAESDPSGYACDYDRTQRVVYRGSNGLVLDLWYTPYGWKYNDFVGSAGVSSTAVDQPSVFTRDASRSIHVIYSRSDNHLQEVYRFF